MGLLFWGSLAERGWNPLNCNILTEIPGNDVVDLVDGDGEETHCPTFLNLNFSNGTGSNHLDKIVEEQEKEEGRKKRFEAIKSDQKTKQQKLIISRQLPRSHPLV